MSTLMSVSPAPLQPAQSTRGRKIWSHWLGVLYAIIFICFTSTSFMGGSHTQILVDAVWKVVFGNWHWDLTGPVNEACRKVGHFFGYGLVGLIFRNAWYNSAKAFQWLVRSWLTPFAASLSIASTFLVACLDEWHQRFTPGRVGSIRDALLDAAGAFFLNVIFWTLSVRNRRKRMERSLPASALSIPAR
jgi:VanZ family protein